MIPTLLAAVKPHSQGLCLLSRQRVGLGHAMAQSAFPACDLASVACCEHMCFLTADSVAGDNEALVLPLVPVGAL